MRSLKSNLILLAICFVISGIVVLYSIITDSERITVLAVVKQASPTTISKTRIRSRANGTSSTITTPIQATSLKIEFRYCDSLYSKEIKREGYTYGAYKKGDTLRISIDAKNPSAD